MESIFECIGIGSDGQPYHTIRYPNGGWQPQMGAVRSQVAGGPAQFRMAASAATANVMQMVCVGTDGSICHTIRDAKGSWQAEFGDVRMQSAGGPARCMSVGCAGVGGDMHLVCLGEDGSMCHTIRHPNGSWQAEFGDVRMQSAGGPARFTAVGCAGVQGELHVVGVGNDGKMYHTMRHADGSWQARFGLVEQQSAGGPASCADVACAGTGAGMQLVCLGEDGKMYHTMRHADGSWQPQMGSIASQSAGGPARCMSIGCAGVGSMLQVVCVGSDRMLYHTIRNAGGHWQRQFGAIESQSVGGPANGYAMACCSSGMAASVPATVMAK